MTNLPGTVEEHPPRPTTTDARSPSIPAPRVPLQVQAVDAASSGAQARVGTVDIDDVPICSMSEGAVVDHVMASLKSRRGGVIATPNMDIMRGISRGHAANLVDEADILVPDGMPLVWASRIQGEPLESRVTGADLFWSLSNAAAAHGRSVFVLGGAPGVAQRAADALCLASPTLQMAGLACPESGFETDRSAMIALERELVQAAPDIVFVALGFPKQEQLSLELRKRMPGTWFLGCGGAVDMAAGDRRRAPRLVRAVGMEWLHRLALEPGRLWRRYLLDDLPYVVGLLTRSLKRRIAAQS